MKTLLGTQLIAQSTADAKAIKASHRATTWPHIQTLGYAYNEALRAVGLAPYSYLWPSDLDATPVRMLSGMLEFWDGKTYNLPERYKLLISKWRGHPLMAQHFGGTHYAKDRLIVFGYDVDSPDWPTKGGAAYAAMTTALRDAGADPYIFMDEPPIVANATLDQQPHGVRWMHRVALACQEASNILVRGGGTVLPCGPALTPAQIAAWNSLGTPFTWLVIKLQSVIEGTKWQTGGYAKAAKGKEIWVYTTSDRRFMPGRETEMAAVLAWARAVMGAVGYLNWTVYPIASRPQDSGVCFAAPPAGTAFDPQVYPLPKLAALAQAIHDQTPPTPPEPPVPSTPTLAELTVRVDKLETAVAALQTAQTAALRVYE